MCEPHHGQGSVRRLKPFAGIWRRYGRHMEETEQIAQARGST